MFGVTITNDKEALMCTLSVGEATQEKFKQACLSIIEKSEIIIIIKNDAWIVPEESSGKHIQHWEAHCMTTAFEIKDDNAKMTTHIQCHYTPVVIYSSALPLISPAVKAAWNSTQIEYIFTFNQTTDGSQLMTMIETIITIIHFCGQKSRHRVNRFEVMTSFYYG